MDTHEMSLTLAVDDGPLLSVNALATFLGVTRRTVYRLIDRGEFHPVRVAGLWRFRRSDVEAYLDRKWEAGAAP